MSIFPSNNNNQTSNKCGGGNNKKVVADNSFIIGGEYISLSDLLFCSPLYQKLKIKIPKKTKDFNLFNCFDIVPNFLLIKPEYCKCPKSTDTLYWYYDGCNYKDDGELCEPNYIGDLMILTGDIGDVIITNPDSKNCVYLNVLVTGNYKCKKVDHADNDYNKLPFFATSVDIEVLTEQDGATQPPNRSYFEFDTVKDSNDNTHKQTFDVPVSFDPIIKIQQYVNLFGNGIWVDVNIAEFDITNVQHTVDGVDVDYYRYTYNGSKIGDRKLRVYI